MLLHMPRGGVAGDARRTRCAVRFCVTMLGKRPALWAYESLRACSVAVVEYTLAFYKDSRRLPKPWGTARAGSFSRALAALGFSNLSSASRACSCLFGMQSERIWFRLCKSCPGLSGALMKTRNIASLDADLIKWQSQDRPEMPL